MMGQIFSYTGAHGTGKTTSAFKRAENLKIEHPGKSVYLMCDQAAFCPYPINKKTSPEAQLWIFTNQINKELSFLSRFDLLVTDRTAVDAVAYAYVAGFEQLAGDMLGLLNSHICLYSLIEFKTIKANDFFHRDGIRESHDRAFRQRVETAMLEFYAILTDNYPDLPISYL